MSQSCIDDALIERANVVVSALKSYKLTVVTAESCTAGLVSAALSLAKGAGDVLHGSFATYTKENKAMALGVDRNVLDQQGSVNAEVVRELAAGALSRSPADLALAVSGVLGPSPDEDGNPVGLVYFCCLRRARDPILLRRDYGAQPHDVLRRKVVLEALDRILSGATSQ